MWRDPALSYGPDKSVDVEMLVAADGGRAGGLLQHQQRSFPFARTGCRRRADVGHAAVAVVEQHVPQIGELRFFAQPRAVQLPSVSVVECACRSCGSPRGN
jgi:hypothetical protein